jgi:type IV pilus assembly protein PilC
MLLFIVPKFGELFINNRHPLPYLTLLVINLSSWLHHWIWVLLSLAIAAVTSGYYSYFVWKEKIIFEKILLRLPLLGPILQKICLAHLMRTLGTLFSAGIPITQMLNITIPCLKLFIYRQALQKLHFDISTGKSFSAALGNNPLFPPMLVQMIHVGEQSGTLEAMFEKVCFWYENDIDQWVGNISQLLEPLIIIVLGVLIGGLVIAMYLPIFNLGNAI